MSTSRRPHLIAACLLVGVFASSLVAPQTARADPQPPPPSADRQHLVEDPTTLGGLEGTPKAPDGKRSGERLEQQARDRAAERSQSVPLDGYDVSGAELQPVADGLRPYDTAVPLPRGGWGLVDGGGVRMFSWAGDPRLWNHPVGQAQYAILNLDSFRLTGDRIYLDRAAANAQRLIDRRVESDGGWYYPYDFDFAVHGDTTETLRAPWYSGMAQGQALSTFVRLYRATQQETWLRAAEATLATLDQTPAGTAPFASWVDGSRQLWLEEYPRYPARDSERVLNGHVFAMYGLHDYWQLTGDPLARRLFLGALSTIEATVPTQFRRPGWASIYSLRHAVNTLSYHRVHINQFLMLWRLTGDRRWIAAATTFRNDFPTQQTSGTLRISPRATTVYRVNAAGAIVERRTVAFSRLTQAPFDRRQRLLNGPIAYRVTAGGLKNWWFPEGFGVSWGLGALNTQQYVPVIPLVFRGGTTFTAYRLDRAGAVVGHKTMTLVAGRDSGAPTGSSAIVQGRPAYYIATGALAGYWVPMQSKVRLG